MGADQLFKDILRAFFYQFLLLFLPHIAAAIEPGSVAFLDTEVFTDVPEGARRVADLVTYVEAREGPPPAALIHTEVQAEREDAFGLRMGRYNAML